MNQEVSIELRNIGKIFRIYDRPRDRLKEAFSLGFKKFSTDFTALRDINLTIHKGDFVGIVGRNGAGKSTLLKILSHELTPTSGQLTVNGVVSLLQLGVGFNPEQTGRENAVFASKILGFSNDKIEEVLESTIKFADIGDFIDHPVKTYSAGMYSRLSFAVGINIDPDILIADEVLSVGDISFSQKCLRKMHEFKEKGKTVVLVTHDTNSVGVFCNRAIWLNDRTIYEQGDAKAVSENYKNYMLYDRLPKKHYTVNAGGNSKAAKPITIQIDNSISISSDSITWVDATQLPQIEDSRSTILEAALIDSETLQSAGAFKTSSTLYLMYRVQAHEDLSEPNFGYAVYDRNGVVALHSNNNICGKKLTALKAGEVVTVCFKIKLPPFNAGDYVFSISTGDRLEVLNRVHDLFPIEIINSTEKKDQKGYLLVTEEDFFLSRNSE